MSDSRLGVLRKASDQRPAAKALTKSRASLALAWHLRPQQMDVHCASGTEPASSDAVPCIGELRSCSSACSGKDASGAAAHASHLSHVSHVFGTCHPRALQHGVARAVSRSQGPLRSWDPATQNSITSPRLLPFVQQVMDDGDNGKSRRSCCCP